MPRHHDPRLLPARPACIHRSNVRKDGTELVEPELVTKIRNPLTLGQVISRLVNAEGYDALIFKARIKELVPCQVARRHRRKHIVELLNRHESKGFDV